MFLAGNVLAVINTKKGDMFLLETTRLNDMVSILLLRAIAQLLRRASAKALESDMKSSYLSYANVNYLCWTHCTHYSCCST